MISSVACLNGKMGGLIPMQKERPIQHEESAELTDQLRQAIVSDQESVTVQFADQLFHLRRVTRGDYTIERAGESMTARVLLTFGPMPPDYPSDLPYLPGEIVMLSGTHREVSAMWWSHSDPEQLLAEIDRQSLASGWTPEAPAAVPPFRTTHRTYRRSDMRRYVRAGQGILGVFQTPTL
jgi:hypothetical protein